MASRTVGNTHLWKCDWCPRTGRVTDDFYVALQRYKDNGWRVFKKDGKWMHICPDCRPRKGMRMGAPLGGGPPQVMGNPYTQAYQDQLPAVLPPRPPPPPRAPQPPKRLLDMGKIEDVKAPKTKAPKLDLEDK